MRAGVRKCVILCFVILCTKEYVTRASNSGVNSRIKHVSDDSDEDEKLKQALVLVDLLKIEYAKALRENHELRQKGSIVTDDATCASTDEPTQSSISPHSTNSQQPGSITADERLPWRRMAGLSKKPFHDFPVENSVFQPYKYFRPRSPVDYYYDYPFRGLRRRVSFRRANEGDPTTAATTATSDAVSKGAPAFTSDVVSKGGPEATPDAMSKGTPAATTHAATSTVPEMKTEPVLLEDTTIDDILDKTSENSETQNKEDLVMSQVADELIHELKSEKTLQPKRKPHSTQRSTKTKLNMKLAKPTLKIHLGGSTRFPIPLPKNHAFCYTNPRNALCRTSI